MSKYGRSRSTPERCGDNPLGRLGWRQNAIQMLQIAHDDGQQIIEIVSNPAGQLSNRLHFLGLTKLFFCRSSFP